MDSSSELRRQARQARHFADRAHSEIGRECFDTMADGLEKEADEMDRKAANPPATPDK
jgi:hypothetical protein